MKSFPAPLTAAERHLLFMPVLRAIIEGRVSKDKPYRFPVTRATSPLLARMDPGEELREFLMHDLRDLFEEAVVIDELVIGTALRTFEELKERDPQLAQELRRRFLGDRVLAPHDNSPPSVVYADLALREDRDLREGYEPFRIPPQDDSLPETTESIPSPSADPGPPPDRSEATTPPSPFEVAATLVLDEDPSNDPLPGGTGSPSR